MHQRVPRLYSAELQGINAQLVEVEADINVGLHSFTIVGLGDKAVSEAKERINSALKHCGIKPPTRENRKITVNLAPANLKKTGSHFDLPIALAYLLMSGQMKSFRTGERLFLGELALDGSVRAVPGALNHALLAKRLGFREIFVPIDNAREAANIETLAVYGVRDLRSLVSHLEGTEVIHRTEYRESEFRYPESAVLWTDIRGLHQAKRAVMITAAGGHNLLLKGPPGTGKTMLAKALLSILPPLTIFEALEISQIYSAASLLSKNALVTERPFRSPHHSASLPALTGGGENARPGEMSLAHCGVLFLDETAEFRRDALQSLRQPLEEGRVVVSRAKTTVSYPARFSLVLAMNPCPCGYFGDDEIMCKCSAHEAQSYAKRLSGPLLDRMDIYVSVPRTPLAELVCDEPRDSSPELEQVREAVVAARKRQLERFSEFRLEATVNAGIPTRLIHKIINLSKELTSFAASLASLRHFSPRAYHRMLKVARTIADLEGSHSVKREHLAEAFQYRARGEDNRPVPQ